MENGKTKPIIIGSVALAAILIIALLLSIGSVRKANKSLNDEKLRSEQLSSEKDQLAGELEKTKADLASLKTNFDQNEKLLAETKNKLEAAEKRARALAGQSAALASAKKEIEQLQQLKTNLEKESAALKAEYDKLLAKNNELQNTINNLENEKKQLSEQLQLAKTYITDNMMVSAVRGKTTEKLVVVARRTKKLNMSFDVPKNLTENITFNIKTPDGQTLTADNKELQWSFPDRPGVYVACLSPVTGEIEEARQVNLTFTPSSKLQPGIYTIELICNNITLGHARIKLR